MKEVTNLDLQEQQVKLVQLAKLAKLVELEQLDKLEHLRLNQMEIIKTTVAAKIVSSPWRPPASINLRPKMPPAVAPC